MRFHLSIGRFAICPARKALQAAATALLAPLCLVLASGAALAAPVLPDFGAAVFVAGAPIDNPFFPLLDHRTRIYQGEFEDEGETVVERFELTFFHEGPTILGVATSTVLDRSFEDDLLVEETYDYYAQDTAGNVWYFGEDVTNYIYDDDGNLIETNSESAWIAGENGALPGYIMPAAPTVGFNYYQEYAVDDEALDQGEIFSLGNDIEIDFGEFTDVLQVLETTELDPDAAEFKYYAPGFGLILVEEGLDPETLSDPEVSVALVRIVSVPEPNSLTLLLAGLGALGIGGVVRRRRAA